MNREQKERREQEKTFARFADVRRAPLAFYWTSVRRLSEKIASDANVWRKFYRRLTPERRAKIERLRMPDDRTRSLAAGLLLDWRFGEKTASIRQNEFGKPTFDDADGVFFNLSHSGDVVALAVSTFGAIGCDVQLREKIAPELIAKRFFHRTEFERFLGAAPNERERVFYRIWALKESYLKALGKGFAAPSNGFCVEAEPRPRLVEPLAATENDANDAPTFFRRWSDDERDVEIAVCSTVDLDDLTRVELFF